MKRNQSIERQNRMSQGFCKFCLQPRIVTHKQLCEKHYVANCAQAALGVCNNQVTATLTDRFNSNPVCPYTGEMLILGVNAHLDHIESKRNRPDLARDINNLEWISEKANLAKNGMSKNEFIQFCSLIAVFAKSP
jgi:5-methylcytosine-specific restriction endonuclease McrA